MKTAKQERERFRTTFMEPSRFYRSRDYWSADAGAVGWIWSNSSRYHPRYIGIRDTGAASDILKNSSRFRLDHTGWYADSEGSELYIPYVWQLPARNRVCQYIAGYIEDGGIAMLSATNGKLDVFDNKEEAARAADRFTEIQAEHARDWNDAANTEFQAEQSVEDARDSMRRHFAECRKMVSELRACGPLTVGILTRIHSLLRAEHEKSREAIRSLSDSLVSLEAARAQVAYLEKRSAQQ